MVQNIFALPDTPDSPPHCTRLVQLSQISARAVLLQQSSLCSGAQKSVGSAATTEICRMIVLGVIALMNA